MPRPPPTAEEIEEFRRQKLVEVIPEGMLKSEWKKRKRQQQWQDLKEEYRREKRAKKKAVAARQREQGTKPQRKFPPKTQQPLGLSFVFDCAFDDLMNQREVVLMLNQIARAYNVRRHCTYEMPLLIVLFDKRLKTRFDDVIRDHVNWKGIEFREEPLEKVFPDTSKLVYFSADTDNLIEELEEGMTYIIGGIVDKNRHKNLCINKAKELGIRVGRLPIDKYIAINGRLVLATSHVYEICCKWKEYGDWERAFNEVLPPRKLKDKSEDDDHNESNTTGEVETTHDVVSDTVENSGANEEEGAKSEPKAN